MNPYRDNKNRFSTYTEVTDKMREVIYELVYSGKSNRQIAKDCGICEATLYAWRKWQPFLDELTAERKRKFNALGDQAIGNLIKLANDDSDKRTQLQAIKLILGENGLLKDSIEVDLKTQIICVSLDDMK